MYMGRTHGSWWPAGSHPAGHASKQPAASSRPRRTNNESCNRNGKGISSGILRYEYDLDLVIAAAAAPSRVFMEFT
jgi:hypothetical protein